jgi:polyprenyl-phospho-N-acetylgalactosaminyl synthase
MPVFVVMPVFNELPQVLQAVINQFSTEYFLVIVDDGSTTPVEVNVKNGIVLRQQINKGQGAAIIVGIEYALKNNANYIATFDADGQHRFADLKKMEATMQAKNCDVVLGSRFNVSTIGMPFTKKLVLKGGVLLQNTVFGMRLTDAHNGFRLLNKHAAQKIKITENRMAHASDIIYQIKLHKLAWCEIPIQVHYSAYAIKKGQSVFNAIAILFLIFKIRFQKNRLREV